MSEPSWQQPGTDLVRLSDEDRAILKEAAHVLAPSKDWLPGHDHPTDERLVFLSARLIGLSGRVPNSHFTVEDLP